MERAPRDPWIASLYSYACRGPGCVREAAVERWLRLDPDNAFAWLAAINGAHGEVPAMIGFLEETGQWPAPPGWQPTWWED